ncbi:MAG TPA: hypothetical protein VGO03_12865 [Acidimicrobiia bacterium]|jgi:hypothetical protein
MERVTEPTRTELGQIESARLQLGRGTRVEVRNHFISSWSNGFEVTGVEGDGYRVRRVSDNVELPATFMPDEVRPQLFARR